MKKQTLLLIAFISIFLMSCSANMLGDRSKLYDNTWELEYITGPRIAFEGLYPEAKPAITFNESTKMVSGTNSCNGYNAAFTANGKMISFAESGPTTMRYCAGGGDVIFLKTMKQITNYKLTADGKLELLMNDMVMMRFKKSM